VFIPECKSRESVSESRKTVFIPTKIVEKVCVSVEKVCHSAL